MIKKSAKFAVYVMHIAVAGYISLVWLAANLEKVGWRR